MKKEDPNWGGCCVDKYELLQQIGEGTYGQVYKAKDKEDGKGDFFLYLKEVTQARIFRWFGRVEESSTGKRERRLSDHGCSRDQDFAAAESSEYRLFERYRYG